MIWSHHYLLCFQPTQTLSHAYHFSILGGARKKWTSWAISCLARETRYSYSIFSFSLWKKLQADGVPLGTEQCSLGGWMIQVKCNCFFFFFLFTLFNASILSLSFSPTVYWNLSDGLLDSYKGILIHG